MGSALGLLKDRGFRRLWLAVILSFLGHFVHVIACAWVMTELTHSATMVALVQTAASLPMVLLSLLAGGFADTLDRRRVMLVAEAGMLLVSLALVGFSVMDAHTPVSLLILIFGVSLGTTLLTPAWQVSLGDLVTREDLPEAISLHTVGANIIKTIGPFVGGLVLAAMGATWTFLLSTLGYVPALFALWRWRPKQTQETRAPLLPAVAEGLRYFRSTPRVFPVVERIFVFALCSIAGLSLLPLVARNQLNGDASTYGLLFGAYGLGAIISGLSMRSLRTRFGIEKVVTGTIAINAAAIIALGLSETSIIGFLASAVAGGGWLLVLTLLNSTLQMASPRRLVGRMVSIFMTFTYIGVAMGGFVWGVAADQWGTPAALVIAGLIMACIVPFAWWRPLPDITEPAPEMAPAPIPS